MTGIRRSGRCSPLAYSQRLADFIAPAQAFRPEGGALSDKIWELGTHRGPGAQGFRPIFARLLAKPGRRASAAAISAWP